MKPDGKAAIVLPTGFLTAKSSVEGKLLKHIVNNHLVYGVISMPSNVFANTGTNVSVVFFDNAKSSDKVILIDASKLGEEYLIFSIVFLNVLKLDIQGSVYALILARILGALCAIALLFFIHPPISMPPKQLFSFDRQLVGSTLRVSVPLGLEQIFSTCGSIVAGMFMVQLGTSAVAVNAISNSLLSVLYAAATSAATLAVTLVGRCIGAERQEEARRYSIESVYICFAILALTSVVFFPLMPLPLNQYHPYARGGCDSEKTAVFELACAVCILADVLYHAQLPACGE